MHDKKIYSISKALIMLKKKTNPQQNALKVY